MKKCPAACWFVGMSAVLLFGCSGEGLAPSVVPQPADVTGETGAFDDRLLEIARSYQEYGRLDTEPRWAPLICYPGIGPPPVPLDVPPRFSMSKDSLTHGRKLYWLFVK